MRSIVAFAVAIVCAAQAAIAEPGQGTPTTAEPPAAAPRDPWTFAVAALTYVVPDDRVYVVPVVEADRGSLHLEGRFNYESLETASAWIGWNVSVGTTVTLDIAPIVGVVLGATNGVAPGYKGSLAWRTLELYSEAEYVFDAGDSTDSFLYTWSELSWAPFGGWRGGLVVQRTKLYKTDVDIERGFFLGWSSDRVDLTAYVLEPWATQPVVVLGAAVRF